MVGDCIVHGRIKDGTRMGGCLVYIYIYIYLSD